MTEIKTYDYVVCPYCKKPLTIIQHTHLKQHGKTTQQFKEEFPGYPIRCGRLDEAAQRGANQNKVNKDTKKSVNCICGKVKGIMVGKFEADYKYLDCCRQAGFENPDGRSNGQGEVNRQKSLQEKYGPGVINISNIDGVTEKRLKTNEEVHGGTGFASKKLARKAKQTMINKGLVKEGEFKNIDDVNIMNSEEGVNRLIKSFQEKYGPNISNALHILDIKKQVSSSLKEYFRENGHHLTGKSYIELYGEEKTEELIKQRRISGGYGFKKSLELGFNASKPQLELFGMVKALFPDSQIELEKEVLNEQFGFYYHLDIAIPEIKLCIEYDTNWTHKSQVKDDFRDKVLLKFGWKTLRIRNKLPKSDDELLKLLEPYI